MAASQSGITQIAAIGNSGWVAAAIATGTHAMPNVNGATFKLDGSLFGQEQGNGPTALVSGRVYSSYYMFATAGNGVDISADSGALQFHIQDRAGGISVMANAADALEVYIFTGGSTANYHTYDVEGRTLFRPGDFVPVQAGHRTPDHTGGTPDLTDVTGIGVGFKSTVNGGEYGLSISISQLIYWSGPVEFTDTNADPTNFADYAALFDRYSGNTYHGLLTRSVGSTIEFCFPIKNTARNFSTANDVTFRVDNAALQAFRDGYYSYEAEPPSGGSQTYSGSKIAGDAANAKVDITLDAATGGGALTCTNISVSGARNVVIDGSAATVSGVFTDPVDFTFGDGDLDITVTEGANTNDIVWNADLVSGSSITTDRDIDITFAETNLSDITIALTASNIITVNPTTGSGTYTLSGLTTTGTVTLDNDTANNTTVVLPAGTSNATVGPPTTGGGTIAVNSPAITFTINSSETGSLIQIFTTGTQTILDSTTGSSLAFVHSGQTIDYVVQKAGFIPQRFTGEVLSGTTAVTINLVADPVYNASHGLTYPTDASWASNQLTVPTFGPSVRGVYSLMIDSFISQTALRNTAFNIFMSGPGTMILTNDAEGASDASIQNMTAGGVRYRSTAGVTTAEWCGVESIGTIPGGATGEYQQVDGSGTTDARATGAFDQIIKTYGDVTHGNFDYRGHLVLKYQINGYYQDRVDILDTYGISALEPTHYIVAMQPEATGIATGDPAISITITDHTAAPITVGGKSYDYEIVDGGTNSAEAILREINYNLSLDATYQGKDPFNYPDMVLESGGNYETQYGRVEGQDTTTTYHGFYVSRSSADHPDFTRFQSNDGTYYTPAVLNQSTITNLPTAGADIRLQIYNVTTATEIYSDDPGAATYSDTYTEGTDYTEGDEIRVRFAELNGATSFKSFQTTVTAGATGWSLNAANFLETDAVYAINAVDGSGVTKFTYSSVDDQFNLTVAANFIAAELFAFYCYTLTTATGIEGAFGAFVAENAGNYKNVTAIASIYLDNETTASQRQTDSARIYRDDSVYPVLDPTTSGYGIDVNWQNVVYVVSTGGSALTAPQAAQLSTIESRTSGLTYTVANQVNANVNYMNSEPVQGDGTAGNKWRGV